jgi:hypothetical protein
MRVVLAFEVKRLPKTVDEAFAEPARNGTVSAFKPTTDRLAPSGS